MNDRNDLTLLDAVERYIKGEMNPDERLQFENLRKADAEVDQLVVEHTLFLQQMNRLAEWKGFQATLHDVHHSLSEEGKIQDGKKAKVAYLWNRYKRVAVIAASIAGITAIGLSALFNSFTPQPKDLKVQQLVKEMDQIKTKQQVLDQKIDNVDKKITITDIVPRFNGTGFLIDAHGLMITNAHVVKNSRNFFVQNAKGDQFRAIVLKLDVNRDVAIIKIDDDNFKPFASLPYGIRKGSSDIAEQVFTLGYPRNEIVYGEGYLSARTGFDGDTLSCQISVDANPGNSGGPVFNKNGEVIGILSARATGTQGAVFAVQSKYIFQALEELKNNQIYKGVKVPTRSTIAGMDKIQQVKKVEDYIFMVKGD
ncbi:MAG TPA: serine protease [Chitinophagaceae bacterium]|nr:serine protease [Chitinophagaceae bacterium]